MVIGRKFLSLAVTFIVLLVLPLSAAALTVVSQKVKDAPVVDGAGFDPAWLADKPIMIRDQASGAKILLTSVYTDDRVYFKVQFPDSAINPLHKPWVTTGADQPYQTGPHREDTFVFKWNMTNNEVNLSNFSDDEYRADVWYWKANRTNQAGYADDKIHLYGSQKPEKATETVSPSGKIHYLQRISDVGAAPYKEFKPESFQGETVNRYRPAVPSGSRADVRAKGQWTGGLWTIEFSRKLDTGHGDDVTFDPKANKQYQFGVSIFSLYGKPHEPNSPNFYGRGQVSEPLKLVFN